MQNEQISAANVPDTVNGVVVDNGVGVDVKGGELTLNTVIGEPLTIVVRGYVGMVGQLDIVPRFAFSLNPKGVDAARKSLGLEELYLGFQRITKYDPGQYWEASTSTVKLLLPVLLIPYLSFHRDSYPRYRFSGGMDLLICKVVR